METGLSELRDTCKPLALATTFEAADKHDRLACIWLLALELDKSVLLPKESMLRFIRLQWWHDAIENRKAQNVPLMQDLLSLVETETLDKDWLFDVIAQWQSVSDAPETLSLCWEYLLVKIAGDDNQHIRDIGHNLFCALQRRPDKMRAVEPFAKLKKVQSGALLRACHYISQRGQTGDIHEDGTLGFRVFMQFLFGSRSV